MLTKREFDLMFLLTKEKHLSQRQMAEKLNCSLGTANRFIRGIIEKGYFDGSDITEKGWSALEPYRVRRAIFIAAGFGSRLVPITLNTPTPLIRINGVRMIDTLLDAVVAAGIPEIIIVRGYLGEQFNRLLDKYPNIKFVDNPLFNESNNISSAMCVRTLFQNAYVLDADLLLQNPDLIRKYEYQSNMIGFPTKQTDKWCVSVDKKGYAESVSIGGTNTYREVGIFYIDHEDGSRLAEDLEEVYSFPGGKERLWEMVPLNYKKEHYKVAIQKCKPEDIIEVDTLKKLVALDPLYNL